MIIHLVLFNPKKGLTVDMFRLFAAKSADCFRSIDSIDKVSIGWHIDLDPGYPRELGEKTYEFAAVIEFRDEAGLLRYLRHPKHDELGRLFWECCEDTVVSEHQMIDGRGDGLCEFLEDRNR